MKKNLSKKIDVPEGVEVKINNGIFVVKGKSGEVIKEFDFGKLEIKQEKNAITLGNKKSTKREKKLMNTLAARIKNMINGVQSKFEYKLKICYSHFPFTISIGNEDVQVKNFLGEKVPRIIKIPSSGFEIKNDKEMIIISSSDKELAGRVAASLERGTRAKNRDKRVFQDGIYITNKAGKTI